MLNNTGISKFRSLVLASVLGFGMATLGGASTGWASENVEKSKSEKKQTTLEEFKRLKDLCSGLSGEMKVSQEKITKREKIAATQGLSEDVKEFINGRLDARKRKLAGLTNAYDVMNCGKFLGLLPTLTKEEEEKRDQMKIAMKTLKAKMKKELKEVVTEEDIEDMD